MNGFLHKYPTWSINNISTHMAYFFTLLDITDPDSTVTNARLPPPVYACFKNYKTGIRKFAEELGKVAHQRIGWKSVVTLILQLYKTLGDLGLAVEFADTDTAFEYNTAGPLTFRYTGLDRRNRMFVSGDITAITFARKLAAGCYQEWYREQEKNIY